MFQNYRRFKQTKESTAAKHKNTSIQLSNPITC